MDAITLLKNDHRHVEKIFSQIEKGDGNRAQLFKELMTELTVHADIEEQIFYPAVKNATQTHDLVVESFEEHKQVKMVLADLARADKNTEEWLAGPKVWMEDCQPAVGEEEKGLFPEGGQAALAEEGAREPEVGKGHGHSERESARF